MITGVKLRCYISLNVVLYMESFYSMAWLIAWKDVNDINISIQKEH